MASTVITTPIIPGQALDTVETVQKMPLGTVVSTGDMGEAVYSQSLSIIAQFNAVAIDENGKSSNLTIVNQTVESGIGVKVGISQVSVPASSFFWAHVSGADLVVNVATACADRVPLFPTSAPGVLDDATTSIAFLPGIYTVSTTSTASAITCVMATRSFSMPWSNPA